MNITWNENQQRVCD